MSSTSKTNFTLVEIIMTIVIVAVLVAMISPSFTTHLKSAPTQFSNLQDTYNIHSVMENIISDYANGATGYEDLASLKSTIDASATYQSVTTYLDPLTLADSASVTTALKITIYTKSGEQLTRLFFVK